MKHMTDENVQDVGAIANAGDVIERFGGIRPMAAKMSVPVTTVQGWKKRNVIPGNRRNDVIRAAEANNINIADILEKGAANENGNTYESVFGSAMTAAARSGDTFKHEQAVAAGRMTMEQEEILALKLKNFERRAVQKSVLASTILIVLTAAFASFLLWPSKARIDMHEQRLELLETEMTDIKQGGSSLLNLLPQDWRDSIGTIQSQTAELQDKFAALASTVEKIMSPDAGPLSERVKILEQHIQWVDTSAGVAAVLDKIRAMQSSAEGQSMMNAAVAAMNNLLAQGAPADIDSTLTQAQQQDPAVAETLGGVPQTDIKAAALLVGLSEFRTALKRNAPFEEDLGLLQKLLGDADPELNAAIERLAPQAKAGVLSPEGLSNEFKALSGDIVVASLKGEDVTMKERALARLNEVMQVQKDGQLITGTDTQASIARAQAMLDGGDVAGAITELQGLQGGAAQTAQPWIDRAQATLLAQQVQQMMTARVGGMVGSADLGSILRDIENMGGIQPADLSGKH